MASRSPRDLLFTLFGEYLLHRPGPVWVGSLIDFLGSLDVSEGAVRTTLSRMGSRGWLVSERRGRNAFYSLTERGRKLLEEGEHRIYHPAWDGPWDGTWRLVTYTVPEEDRSLRDRLRLRLSWLGFGTLGNGLMVTPHDVGDRVEEVAGALDVADRVELFEARHLGFSDADRLVERCWDLPGIHRRYLTFIDRHLPRFRRFRAEREAGRLSPEEAFVHRFDLVHEYRDFAQVDPYLPQALLPDDWAGECAAGLFRALHDLLEASAEAHVDRTLERAAAETGDAAGRGDGAVDGAGAGAAARGGGPKGDAADDGREARSGGVREAGGREGDAR